MTVTKTDQVLDFIYKNEGKLTTVEFRNECNFFMVSLNSLHIHTEEEDTISISDKKDDPENLVKGKFPIIGFYGIKETDYEMEIEYTDGSKVLISVY